MLLRIYLYREKWYEVEPGEFGGTRVPIKPLYTSALPLHDAKRVLSIFLLYSRFCNEKRIRYKIRNEKFTLDMCRIVVSITFDRGQYPTLNRE